MKITKIKGNDTIFPYISYTPDAIPVHPALLSTIHAARLL